MKLFKRSLWLSFIVLAVLVYFNYPKLKIITGFAAKNMASSIFIAKRSFQSITDNDNNESLIKLADTEISDSNNRVTATIFGLMARKAICRDGLGCALLNDEYKEKSKYLKPNRVQQKYSLPFPYGNQGIKDTVFANVDYNLLDRAVENAFSNPDIQKTRTLLVAYKNNIIAERYLDGFSPDTPILGWSMTKSVLATLYAIRRYKGKLDINKSVPIDSWKNDQRRNITYNHLLRMQSGLAWDEDYSSISDVTRMLFMDSDMTLAQQTKKSVAKPTKIWNYSSGTSNLLSGLLRKQFVNYQEYLDFPYTELIDKIGMNSMILETDLSGNYVASSYGWASTRDWAKFGLLYLNKGNWSETQIFNPQWVDYVAKPTESSNGTYGAHFWLNANGKYPDVPKDLFSANGYQGQYVFIIPSKDLVVVRTGLAEEPLFDVNRFLKEVIAAIK